MYLVDFSPLVVIQRLYDFIRFSRLIKLQYATKILVTGIAGLFQHCLQS